MWEYIIIQCGDGSMGSRLKSPETNEFWGTWYMLRLLSLTEKDLVSFVVSEPLIAALGMGKSCSLVECLLNMWKSLDLIPSSAKITLKRVYNLDNKLHGHSAWKEKQEKSRGSAIKHVRSWKVPFWMNRRTNKSFEDLQIKEVTGYQRLSGCGPWKHICARSCSPACLY